MKKISCDLAKDLMIPYLDGICSDEGKNLVDRHLDQCDECKAFLESISSKETYRELYELNHLKKMNIMMKLRMLMTFLVPFILSICVYNTVKDYIKPDGTTGVFHVFGTEGVLPVQLFYLTAMPVLMLCFSFAFSDVRKIKIRKIKIPAVISASALLFITALESYIIADSGYSGPLDIQMCCKAVMFTEAAVLVLYSLCEKRKISFLHQSIAWLGLNIAVMFYSVLTWMTDTKTCVFRMIFGLTSLIIEFLVINLIVRIKVGKKLIKNKITFMNGNYY